MTREEHRFEVDTLKGNICRICVTDDLDELDKQLDFAIGRLKKLYEHSRNRIIEKELEND